MNIDRTTIRYLPMETLAHFTIIIIIMFRSHFAFFFFFCLGSRLTWNSRNERGQPHINAVMIAMTYFQYSTVSLSLPNLNTPLPRPHLHPFPRNHLNFKILKCPPAVVYCGLRKLQTHLLRTQSSEDLLLKPGVGQNLAMHGSPIARDFFPC